MRVVFMMANAGGLTNPLSDSRIKRFYNKCWGQVKNLTP